MANLTSLVTRTPIQDIIYKPSITHESRCGWGFEVTMSPTTEKTERSTVAIFCEIEEGSGPGPRKFKWYATAQVENSVQEKIIHWLEHTPEGRLAAAFGLREDAHIVKPKEPVVEKEGAGAGAGAGAGSASVERGPRGQKRRREASPDAASKRPRQSDRPVLEPQKSLAIQAWQALRRAGYFEEDPGLTAYGNQVNVKYAEILLDNALKAFRALEIDPTKGGSIDFATFYKLMRQMKWGYVLTQTTLEQLYFIAKGGMHKPLLPVADFLLTVIWLGDVDLNAEQSPPAALAISLISHVIKNPEFGAIFRGFVARSKLDTSKGWNQPILCLNEGRLSWKSEGNLVYFHRNLVLSNPLETDPIHIHRLLINFDPKTGQMITVNDMLNKIHARRKGSVLVTLDVQKSVDEFNALLFQSRLAQHERSHAGAGAGAGRLDDGKEPAEQNCPG